MSDNHIPQFDSLTIEVPRRFTSFDRRLVLRQIAELQDYVMLLEARISVLESTKKPGRETTDVKKTGDGPGGGRSSD